MKLTALRNVLSLSFVALVAMSAWTVEANGATIEARHSGNRVVWTAQVPYQAATLTVAIPDGIVVEHAFTMQENISFSPYDLEGEMVVEGLYTWQLVLSPVVDSTVREAMEAAREAGNLDSADSFRARGDLPAEDELVHSGSFRMTAAGLVSGNVEENGPEATASVKGAAGSGGVIDADDPTRDQVILDDLIVDGSACVGFDCVNGESFGFDTIRMKENNLRLHFEDTSNSASFPSNDWRIVANDTSNGGAAYLAIEDSTAGRQVFRVTAGAPANSLLVDSAGDVGLGTSNPVLEVHVADGDSPALRLEQNGTSGFTPQTWDIAGNETNFFVRDATNGSKIPFKIRPGAPTNSLFVDTDGDIGLGTASPDAKLHVLAATGGGAVDSIHLQNNGPSRVKISNTTIINSATNDQDWILNSNGTFRISAGADAAEFVLDGEGNLKVTGSYMVNGTTLNVPDFVFADGYTLMSLDDLDDFVTVNRHLPGIPSATDVNSGVLDMTALQLQLLQKIEELTLYTLQQQSKIEQLHGRIETLEGDGN